MSTYPERVRAAQTFSVGEARALVRDLIRPHLSVYWTDLLLSVCIGYVAAAVVVVLSLSKGPWYLLVIIAYPVAVLALYRAAVFIHEIVHFGSRSTFRPLRLGWNAVVGVPLLSPIFMYESHLEHHSRARYGTRRDAEYLPLALLSPVEIVKILVAAPVLPLFGPIRFGVLGPLSWLVPATREYVCTYASTLKLDVDYRGRLPAPGAEARSWICQEVCCLAVVAAVIVGCVTELVPWAVPITWYAVFAGVLAMNSLRLLGAHRYLASEEGMTIIDQMLDTINHPRHRVLGELWGPLGLRLHALHHLLPVLPYHAYPAAHRRLVAALPPGSAYRLTESPGLLRSICELWRVASQSHAGKQQPTSGTSA